MSDLPKEMQEDLDRRKAEDAAAIEQMIAPQAYSEEERAAWDGYAAAAYACDPNVGASDAAGSADALLTERRRRFPPRQFRPTPPSRL